MAKDFKNSKNSGAFAELAPEVIGTVPPQAVELEEAVLGALMLESDKITEVQEYLTEASFYKEEHRLIYRVMNELALAQQPIDLFTVTNQLKSKRELKKVGSEVPALSPPTDFLPRKSTYARKRIYLRTYEWCCCSACPSFAIRIAR